MPQSDPLVACIGIIAGALQILGYVVYIFKTLKKEVEPNPTSWLMFAYGTAIIAVLEFDRGAKWTLLFLPVCCALLSVTVATICWRRGTMKWPKKLSDRFSFLADVLLTIGYAGSWMLVKANMLSDQEREISALAFLICSNLTTFTAFWPMLRETRANPVSESVLPWIIWTGAYATLTAATLLESGFQPELVIYPAINVIIHASMVWMTYPRNKDPEAVHKP